MLARAWPILEKSPYRTLPVSARQREGLALLGLAAVMAFLVIVLVATVVVASWVRQSGKEQLTARTLKALAGAVMVYQKTTGEFPPTVSSNAQLLEYLNKVQPAREALESMPAYVFRNTAAGKEILDGWARPVSYIFDAAAKRPTLVSQGPDSADPADNLYAEGLGSEF